jgi:hypothetical protein
LSSVGSNTSASSPTAAGGTTTVEAGVVRVIGGGQLIAATSGAAPAGDVRVRATRVEVDGAGAELTRISSNTLGDASGAGGNIVIDADEVVARRGGVIDSSTGSTGAGGNITVNARTVLLDRERDDVPSTGLASQSLGDAAGPAGVLTVNATEAVTLRGGASIAGNTSGGGRGGDVRVTAPLVELDGRGSQRITSIAAEATNITGAPFEDAPPVRVRGGDGGSVEVVADVVRLAGSSQIAAGTVAEGAAGRVSVVARQKLSIDGTDAEFSAGLFSNATNFGLGGASEGGVTFPPIPGAGPGGNGGPVSSRPARSRSPAAARSRPPPPATGKAAASP